MPDTVRDGELGALLEMLRLGPDELFRHEQDAVVLLNRDGSIAYVNPSFTRIFGYSPVQVLGHAVEVLIPEEHRQAHVAWREEFVRHPRSRHMAERGIKGRHADGSELDLFVALSWVDSRLGPIPLARVRMRGFVRTADQSPEERW